MTCTLVIIPTYNEGENVEPLVQEIMALAPKTHVVFVDDNSQDDTRTRIESLMQERPQQVHLIKRERKLGLGTAYVTAFKWALQRSYKTIVEMDADFSHRPEDLVRIIDAAQNAPVVIGSRYCGSGTTKNWGLLRKIISRGGSFYARSILGMRVKDLTGGFNAWSKEVLNAINIDEIRSEGYSFQIELKYRAALAGFPLKELPIVFVERRAGKSKMSGCIVVEAIYRVWQLALKRGKIKQQMAIKTS
jgi:dolichol-phosphate mannosyltransferase